MRPSKQSWKTILRSLFESPQFGTPATPDDLENVWLNLDTELPEDLKNLLKETNGLTVQECGVVWSTQDMVAKNMDHWTSPVVPGPGGALEEYLFIGGEPGGHSYAYRRSCIGIPRKELLYQWNPNSSTFDEFATDLQEYLVRWKSKNR